MMIGDQAVGKTALLVRYADDDFNESVLPTIGIDFKIKVRRAAQPSTSWTGPFCHALPRLQTVELNGKRIKLQIWDTAGQAAPCPTSCSLPPERRSARWRAAPSSVRRATCAQERFRTITQAYYRGAMGILLIFDVTNSKTLSNIRNWVRNIEGAAAC